MRDKHENNKNSHMNNTIENEKNSEFFIYNNDEYENN